MPTPLSPESLLADRRWIEDLARRLVRDANTADDVAQEAWRRALERPPASVLSPRGWLHSLVKSCAREARRTDERRERRERAASRPERTADAASLVVRADAQRAVLAAVLALDPASREVVLLRYFDELGASEIARRLGESAATVRSRLHRALAVLRKRLDGEYGGDRGAWAGALCGPAWRRVASSAEPSTTSKGVLVMTTQAKAAFGAAAFLALLLVWWNSGDGTPARAAAAAGGVAAAPAPRAAAAKRDAAADGTATTQESSPSPAPAAAPAAPGPTRLAVRVVELTAPDTTPDVADGKQGGGAGAGAAIAPADGVAVGGGMVLTGAWTKWKPVPEKGTATLRGKVTDSRGAPLAGAEILRVEPSETGAEGDVRDYSHIATIGESAADGSFAIDAQPARAYRLVANWHHAMDRPQGLLLGALVPVEPHEREAVSGIELRLPIDGRDFGAVAGRVLDDEGDPVQADVSVGSVSAKSDREGRFRLAPVAAGDGEVVVDDSDYRPLRRPVTVRAGADVAVELRLTQKLAGPNEIDGFVRDTAGRAVADAPILCGGIDDVYRRQRTGADGSFRFRRLPALPQGAGWYLSVSGDGVVLKTVENVAAPSHGLVVAVERSVKLRLLVRDAATGAALPLFNVTIDRPVVTDGTTVMEPIVMSTLYEEDGTWTVEVPRGELAVFVEAPEHRGLRGAIDVPQGDSEFEAVIEMQR